MAAWEEELEQYQVDTAYKVNKAEYSQLKHIIDKTLCSLYIKVKALEIGHREEQALRSLDDKKVFKDLRCITCDMDAVMEVSPDIMIPILPPCPARFHLASQLSPDLYLFRAKGAEPLQNVRTLSKIVCPTEVSCDVKVQEDTHCKRFGKEMCTNIEVCTANSSESLVKVSELNDFGPQVTQLNLQFGIEDGGMDVKDKQISSQTVSTNKKVPRRQCTKSSKNITKKIH